MRLMKSLEIPREHGAWTMLAVALGAGLITAGRPGEGSFWLVLVALLAFSSRESLVQTLRAWRRGRSAGSSGRLALVKLALVALTGGVLFFRLGLWGLLAPALAAGVLGSLHLKQALAGRERTVGGQMVAIAAITMAAPAAHYATLGVWNLQAVAIWGLCAIYFPSAVFYLKVRVGSMSSKRASGLPQVRWQCATYHALLALVVVALAAATPLGPALVLAYLAVLLRATWYLVRPSRALSLKRIGYLEVAYSAIFLSFLVIAMR